MNPTIHAWVQASGWTDHPSWTTDRVMAHIGLTDDTVTEAMAEASATLASKGVDIRHWYVTLYPTGAHVTPANVTAGIDVPHASEVAEQALRARGVAIAIDNQPPEADYRAATNPTPNED